MVLHGSHVGQTAAGYLSTYRGGRSKISRVRPYFASMHASMMRCENFFTGRATRVARPPTPVAPPLRARARNEGPNRRFWPAHPVGILVLVILMCGEPRSDILAQKRDG